MGTVQSKPRGQTFDHVAELVAQYFDSDGGELVVGGLGVRGIAARHGTPLFIYDQETLGKPLRALRDALTDRFDVFYSVKANPNQALLRYFVSQGCGLEIASSGELHQALAAGCPAERIFFAGPGKTEPELAAALEQGVGEIHVESLREARRISTLAEQRGQPAHVALRINPSAEVEGGGMRMGGRPAVFGIDEDQLDAVLDEIADDSWLRIVGIHMFVGTQILDHAILLEQYRAALDLARKVSARLNRPLETIDFGGGLGVPYFAHERALELAQLKQGMAGLLRDVAADPVLSSTRLVVEPGRFLVAPAGLYVAAVTDIKESRGKKFIVVDGGMHHHLAASGNLGQTIKRNYPVAVVTRLDQPSTDVVDVVGPLCTPLDVLARGIELPAVEEGDLIGIFQSGAYARAASPLGFLSRLSPPEVLVERGSDILIRSRGTEQDYLVDQVSANSTVPTS